MNPTPLERKCKHNPKHYGPTGYLQWHEWAYEKVKKGWRQKWCPKCKLYIEWTKP